MKTRSIILGFIVFFIGASEATAQRFRGGFGSGRHGLVPHGVPPHFGRGFIGVFPPLSGHHFPPGFFGPNPFIFSKPFIFHPDSRYRDPREIWIIDIPPPFIDRTGPMFTAPGGGWNRPRLSENFSTDSRARGPGQLAPFDPTPQAVVERMLHVAGVKENDVVYDLGSGDGRVVIAAAKKYGVRAVGFEIDPGLARLARENVRKEGVGDLVEIRQQDFLRADLSPATVVTLYLSYDGNLAVRPELLRQLRPGSRLVSYTFDMGDWPAKIVESYRDEDGETHMIYYWEMGGSQAISENRR